MEKDNIPLCYKTEYATSFFLPDIDLDTGSKFDKNSNCEALFFDIFENEIKNSICIYTDVSKIPGIEYSGYAVVTLSEDISSRTRAPNFFSIFTLEVLAILEALIIEKCNSSSFIIFSDSKSTLTALSNFPYGNRASYLTFTIRDKIRRLTDLGRKIKLVWISSHCGIIGNELADTRAKSALHIEKDCTYGTYFNWCDVTARKRGKFYFNNYFVKNRDPWFKRADLPRKVMVSLCRMR